MAKKNIHTVPADGRWAVKREGQEKPLFEHRTKELTETRGRQEARKDGVEHIIHGRDGKIQDKDSYGHDPVPPRDKKH